MTSSRAPQAVRAPAEAPTVPPAATEAGQVLRKSVAVLRSELAAYHPALRLVELAARPLPIYVGSRVRTSLLRAAGFRLGRGTLVFGLPVLTGPGQIRDRLVVGRECLVSWGCYLDLEDSITIGDRVGISPQVSVITSAHGTSDPRNRVGSLETRPVVLQDGAWLGVRCTILPGVTVGEGAVVAAGAVVTRDVPAHTIVGGVPATPIRHLDT